MSRLGKLPITIPDGVTVTIDGRAVAVHGPKGDLSITLHPSVRASVVDGAVAVEVHDTTNKDHRALWGLSRQLIANMVIGVRDGFSKILEVEGIGFRVAVKGTTVVLQLGFSHPVEFQLPQGIVATAEGNTLTITGTDKQLVGETAARIRALKKPEPYKGKGIHYQGETIRRKAGKVVKAAEG